VCNRTFQYEIWTRSHSIKYPSRTPQVITYSRYLSIFKICLSSSGISYTSSRGTKPRATRSSSINSDSSSRTRFKALAMGVTSSMLTIQLSTQVFPTSPDIPICILLYGSTSSVGVRSGSHCTRTSLLFSSSARWPPLETLAAESN